MTHFHQEGRTKFLCEASASALNVKGDPLYLKLYFVDIVFHVKVVGNQQTLFLFPLLLNMESATREAQARRTDLS